MPTRRQILARATGLGATSALAGCFWDTTNNSSLAIHLEHVSRTDLGQTDVADVAELAPRARQVVDEGIANGTTVYGRRPFSHQFVRVNDTYYAIRVTANGTGTVERPVLSAERVSSIDGPAGNRSALTYSDELAVRCAVVSRDESDAPPCVLYAGNESAFWPEPALRYIERGEDEYDRFSVAWRNVTLDRSKYSFERVGGNRSAFADYAAREHVAIDFSTDDLSARQREILDTAAGEGVYRESPPPYSDALRGLADRLAAAGGSPGSGVYVRYGGAYYLAHQTQSWDD